MAMTKDEFHSACKRHGMTMNEFADAFGVAESTVYQWGARTGIPRWAVRILGVMDQHGAAIFKTAASSRRRQVVQEQGHTPAAAEKPPQPSSFGHSLQPQLESARAHHRARADK